MDENFQDVGKRIAKKLEELKLKQVDARKATGLSKNAISNYISGNRIPDTASAYKLSKLLHVSMEWLLTGEEHVQEEYLISDQRSKYEVDPLWPLSEPERDMLWKYRQLDERDQLDARDNIEMKYRRVTKKGMSSNSRNGGGSGEEAAAKELA